MKKIIHLLVCDNCGAEITETPHHTIQVRRGHRLLKRGDLCPGCVESVPAVHKLGTPRKYTRKTEVEPLVHV